MSDLTAISLISKSFNLTNGDGRPGNDGRVLEDDLGMMEDDLGMMEDDLEMMEDDLGVMENDLGVMEDDLGILQLPQQSHKSHSNLTNHL